MKAAPMMEKYQLRRLSFHCAIANRCAALFGFKYSSAAAAAAGLAASSFPMAMKPSADSTGSSSADGKKHKSKLPIPPAPAEGEMQAETAVQPSRRHQAELPALRTRRPKIGNHARVVRRQPEQFIGEARRRGVADQQDRHREAEHDAEQFQRRQAEGAPLIDREQRHHEMSGERAVEQNGARQAVPDLDRDLHSGFGRIERDQAERVIEEMRSDVGEKNEAGSHPQVPAHRTGEPFREQLLAPGYDAPASSRGYSPLRSETSTAATTKIASSTNCPKSTIKS